MVRVSDDGFDVEIALREGFRSEVVFPGRGIPMLVMDEPEPLGRGEGPNAALLLGAAVGQCLSASLMFCLRKARVNVRGIHTKVHGGFIRNERGRRRVGGFMVSITVDAGGEGLERCRELFEDFCVVTGSVRQGIDVKVDVSARPMR